MLLRVWPNFVALLLMTILIVNFGYRDLSRAIPSFQMDALAGQAEILKGIVEPSVASGIPLEQFPGFNSVARPILLAAPLISAIAVIDAEGALVFYVTRNNEPPDEVGLVGVYRKASFATNSDRIQIAEIDDFYRLTLPVANKLEHAGEIQITTPRLAQFDLVVQAYWYVPIAGAVFVGLYMLGLIVLMRRRNLRGSEHILIFALAVSVMAIIVLISLVTAYSNGIQVRTIALTSTLGNRLAAPTELGLELGDLEGVDEIFTGYIERNVAINSIALVSGTRIVAHTDRTLIGTAWADNPTAAVTQFVLPQPQSLSAPPNFVRVSVGRSAVLDRLWLSIRFYVLGFVAIMALFLFLFTMLRRQVVTTYIAEMVPKIGVMAVSISLLLYVGYGEGFRTYPQFQMDTLAAQAESVTGSLDSFLDAGLPLEQFPGFATLTRPVIESDQNIAAIVVTDTDGAIVFSSARSSSEDLAARKATGFVGSGLAKERAKFSLTENPTFYRVTVGLKNKLEPVGNLHILAPRAVTATQLDEKFLYVPFAAMALGSLYIVLIFFMTRYRLYSRRLLTFTYTVTFVMMALVVIATLINTYAEGVQGKTKALTQSLAYRLRAPIELGLDVTDLADITPILSEYRLLNPDISFVSLTIDGKILVHTDESLIGGVWAPPATDFVYEQELVRRKSPADPAVIVHLGIPQSAIYEKLWRSVKNFIVLFVACGFISLVLFNLMQALRGSDPTTRVAIPKHETGFQLIQMFLFLSVFVEGLSASFLSPYFRELGQASGVSQNMVSLIFTVYFAAIAISLIPAGRLAERGLIKPLLIVGGSITGLALVSMNFVNDFWIVFVIRAIAGVGQGLLSVGIQSYSLEASAGRGQTQGAAAVVFGSGAGLISGTAIGALLAVYLGPPGVFALGGVINVLLVPFAILLIPALTMSDEVRARVQASGNIFSAFGRAFRDAEFFRTIVLVGLPTKAVLTGVVLFAVPIILTQQQYAREDIGQIILLYSVGTLLISPYVAKVVDRTGRSGRVLSIGALVSGIGMFCLGLIGLQSVTQGSLVALGPMIAIIGITVLGLGHGIIGAPLITHVTNTEAGRSMGRSASASLYRFFERFGNVGGPLIAAQLLYINNDSALTISLIGVVTVVLGGLFLFRFHRSRRTFVQA